jgi:OOP family OmpA-OmpF porin
MDKRILAVLIAALAGGAYAQSGYVTQSAGNQPVLNSSGGCWQTGASSGTAGPCVPANAQQRTAAAAGTASAPREQVAQSGTRADPYGSGSRSSSGATSAQRAPAGMAGTPAGATTGAANNDAYLFALNERSVVVNSSGHCVRTSSWSPAKAAAPCDAVPRASIPAPVVAAAPAPEPQPTPAPAPLAQATPEPPAPPVLEKITLSTDVLFPFNKAELLAGGRDKLDDLAKSAQGAEVDRIVLAGYADRIGSDEYNRDLSERRAQAVADYLVSKGVDQSRIQVEGRGEGAPVTGDQCKRMGPEKASNKKLVSCLQPDRRVEAELLGSREVARGTSSPATGATSTGTTGSSSATGESSGGSSSR